MLLWFLLALMTGVAVLAVLVPLSARGRSVVDDGDTDFYREQIGEIGRDLGRGLIGDREAEAARAEAARRLLRSTSAGSRLVDLASEPALRRRRAASALALSVVPIVALAVYGTMGSPHSVSQQAALAAAAPPSDQGTTSAIARIEAHLAANPDDARGWDLVAPIYLRLGRIADAADAFASARRAGGDTSERLMGFGEAKVVEANGVVSAEARAAFARGLELDPSSPRGRFYLALAAEQEGDAAAARAGYGALVAAAPPGAPWLAAVQGRLAGLGGAPVTDAPAADAPPGIAPESVTPDMIAGMVASLDSRLAAQGGTEPEWVRLVRSYAVLRQRSEAVERLGRARVALAGDPGARARLDQLAFELGLVGEVAGK